MSHSYRRLQSSRFGIIAGLLGLVCASFGPTACHHDAVDGLAQGLDPQTEGVLRSVPRYNPVGKVPSEALVPTSVIITETAPADPIVPGIMSCPHDPIADLYTTNPTVAAEAKALLDRMLTTEERIIQLTGQEKPSYSDNARWSDIQQSRNDDELGIRGYQWRDGPHGINLEAGLDWR